MTRAGDWLSGPPDPRPAGAWRGERLGLPQRGPGSVAGTGARFLALAVDIAVGALIGGLVNGLLDDPGAGARSLVVNSAFVLQLLVLQSLTGQSIGMRLLGIRVARMPGADGPPGFLPVAVRTVLILLVVPALLLDSDGRGLHDKAAGTVVLRR